MFTLICMCVQCSLQHRQAAGSPLRLPDMTVTIALNHSGHQHHEQSVVWWTEWGRRGRLSCIKEGQNEERNKQTGHLKNLFAFTMCSFGLLAAISGAWDEWRSRGRGRWYNGMWKKRRNLTLTHRFLYLTYAGTI